MKFGVYILLCVSLLLSCKSKNAKKRFIAMSDSTLIVTEKDSQYLKNYVRDISDERDVNNLQQTQKMMQQVDSASKMHELENQSNSHTAAVISGINANFGDCRVTLGFNAKSKTDSVISNTTLSYQLLDKAYPSDVKIKVEGLQDAKVQQRVFTRLNLNNGQTIYKLNDLGEYTGSWITLPGMDNVFIAINKSQIQFNSVDNRKINLAYEQELRREKKSNKEIKEMLQLTKNTQSYNEAPCEVQMIKTQFKISGKIKGKTYTKTVNLYLP